MEYKLIDKTIDGEILNKITIKVKTDGETSIGELLKLRVEYEIQMYESGCWDTSDFLVIPNEFENNNHPTSINPEKLFEKILKFQNVNFYFIINKSIIGYYKNDANTTLNISNYYQLEFVKIQNKLMQRITEQIKLDSSLSKLGQLDWFSELHYASDTQKKKTVTELNKVLISFEKIRKVTLLEYIHTEQTYTLGVLKRLLKKQIQFNEFELIGLFTGIRSTFQKCREIMGYKNNFDEFPMNEAIQQSKYYLKKNKPSKEFKSFIKQVKKWKELDMYDYYSFDKMMKVQDKLKMTNFFK